MSSTFENVNTCSSLIICSCHVFTKLCLYQIIDISSFQLSEYLITLTFFLMWFFWLWLHSFFSINCKKSFRYIVLFFKNARAFIIIMPDTEVGDGRLLEATLMNNYVKLYLPDVKQNIYSYTYILLLTLQMWTTNCWVGAWSETIYVDFLWNQGMGV